MASNQRYSGSQNSHQAPKFVLNIAAIEFDDAEVEIGVFPYEGHEQLAELRSNHGSTHVFRREGGSEVVAVPFIGDAPTLGDRSSKVWLKDNLGLAAALYRNALINHLSCLPRRVVDYMPVSFLADELKDNLLRQALPVGMECPDWLSVAVHGGSGLRFGE